MATVFERIEQAFEGTDQQAIPEAAKNYAAVLDAELERVAKAQAEDAFIAHLQTVAGEFRVKNRPAVEQPESIVVPEEPVTEEAPEAEPETKSPAKRKKAQKADSAP